MSRAGKGDRVIVQDGREGKVTDAAEFDNLVRVEFPGGVFEFMPQSQITYNISEVDFAKKTSDLLLDWTFVQV